MSEYEKAFYRCKRALRHLMRKNHELCPARCAGCLEVAAFIAIPGYRGDEDDPSGVDWEVAR